MKKKIKEIIIQFIISLGIAFLVYLALGSFILTFILYAILIILIMIHPLIWVMNKLVKRTNWYRNKVGDGIKFHKQIKVGLDICNLGSNSGKFAFEYNDTGVNGENWAIGPQTLSYDFRILKNYFSYLKKGATVLLPLCPFSGCIKDFDTEHANNKYYSILHPILIQNYSQKTKNKVMKFINNPFLSSPLKATFRILKDTQPLKSKVLNDANLNTDSDKFINSWKQQFIITNLDTPVSEQNHKNISYNIFLLKEIFSFCVERELKPVIVIPPVTKALCSKLSETFRKNYIYPLTNTALKNQVIYLDYFDDERFAEPELFLNSYYLNTKGSKIFTKQVLKDLELI